jgi:hypothetical protein
MILKDVVATVSTKNRTNTTLPLVITSILCSTYKPGLVIVYDDNDEFKDPRENEIYKNLLTGLNNIGVNWYWVPGQRKGQIHNHEHARLNGDQEYVWRIDDDNILPARVLEGLYNFIKSDAKIGAVGPSILDPKLIRKSKIASNAIKDINLGLNVQWNWEDKISIQEVEHLQGSTFLYRRAAASHGYNLNLSRVAHREETIFTYEMFRNGWKLYAICGLNTWHMRYGGGGIRDFNIKSLFDKDEEIFQQKLKEWKVTPYNYKFIYLDNGRGDHYAFKKILSLISERHSNKKIIIGACYPDVFWDIDLPNVVVTTMGEIAEYITPDTHNIYKFMGETNFKGSLSEAFKKIHL